MKSPQFILGLAAGLVVDLFAGGGGASTGIEAALGRHVDIAINHNADAIGMHEINHPQAKHYIADVWEIDPKTVTHGRHIDLLHASPDCTHHSQALGGQPRDQEIRSLAWIVHRWAALKPDIITLENVEQMLQWSPLVAKRDKATGRVVTLDKVVDPTTGRKTNRVAEPGEQVPRRNQFLVPDKKRISHNWNHFVAGLRKLGYVVQWKVYINADLGAHSTRKRLYMVARCDGKPIVWPEQTHAKKPKKGMKRWLPAADCIDWSIQGRSIFGREKSLVDATLRRVAHGMHGYVLNHPDPFIVPATHTDASNRARSIRDPLPTVTGANRGELMMVAPTLVPVTHMRDVAYDVQQPMRTITTAKGGETALAAAVLVQAGHGEGEGATKRRSYGVNDIKGPVGTITASGGGQSIATAFMVQANGGFNDTPARDIREPMSTVTTTGSQQQLITAHLTALRRNSKGTDLRQPLPTITAGGEHHGLVTYHLSKEQEEGALRCAAFLMRYHGDGGQWADLRDPMTTVTTHDRLALVTVWFKGEPWVIVDICLRMLTPRELYNAQDFPPDYIIDRTSTGKLLSKTAQVHMCGNSVSPLPMRLIVAANCDQFVVGRRAAA